MQDLTEIQSIIVEKIAELSHNTAYVKFSDVKPEFIEYIQLEGMIYSNPETAWDEFLKHCELINRAVNMVRSYTSVEDHKDHIDPAIFQYHPAWIELRNYYGLNHYAENAILCAVPLEPDSYLHQYQDMFISLGINAPINKNIDSDEIMTCERFEDSFDSKYFGYFPEIQGNHPDFIAFSRTCLIIKEIENYKKLCELNQPVAVNYQSVNYMLDKFGFPILTIGYGKKRKKYDFRKPEEVSSFYQKLNNKTEELVRSNQSKVKKKIKAEN